MKRKIFKIHPKDNVAVALCRLEKGEKAALDSLELMATELIPKGHKIATINLKENDKVIKFGYEIGTTTTAIAAGSWIHTHNLKTNLHGKNSYSYNPVFPLKNQHSSQGLTFNGFKRENGKAGTRNEIWIINTVGCVNSTATKIAACCREKFQHQNCDGVYSFTHPFGCSQLGDDLANTQKILAGLINHPNAGGVLVLGLGCENNQVNELLKIAGKETGNRIKSLTSQSVNDEIEEGIKAVGQLFSIVKKDARQKCPLSELVLGMKCGGSDSLSGITANPLAGRITDMVIQQGGTSILTEVPEMFGAEQVLMNRAKSKEVFRDIVSMINNFKEYFIQYKQPVFENPSPGNKKGGLTTLEEKSLGAIQKGGTALVNQVLDYGKTVSSRGLVLLNSPGNDAVSSTALVASGATLLLFTTGRGTPLGAPVPTIKVSSNTDLLDRKPAWIDFDAGRIVMEEISLESLGRDLLDQILNVASGNKKTKNEISGSREIAIWKNGVTL